MGTSNFSFFKKRSSWTKISFAKCEGYFRLDLWVATHAKTGRRNDFREYRSKIRFLDNTQIRNSQTVSLAEIFFLYRKGMCWWPRNNRKAFIFYKLNYHYCHYNDLWSLLFPGTQRQCDTFLACLRSGVRYAFWSNG